MVSINDLTNKPPFENLGMTAEQYIGIVDLVNTAIEVIDYEFFEGRKNGKGIYLAFRLAGETALHYTTTHSGSIMGKFEIPAVQEALEAPQGSVDGTVVRRPSKTNPSMTVITIE